MSKESFIDNVSFEENRGAWVVWDNDPGKAAQLKQLYPYDPVLLYDSQTGNYERYTIEVKHQNTIMKAGKLIHESENIKV